VPPWAEGYAGNAGTRSSNTATVPSANPANVQDAKGVVLAAAAAGPRPNPAPGGAGE